MTAPRLDEAEDSDVLFEAATRIRRLTNDPMAFLAAHLTDVGAQEATPDHLDIARTYVLDTIDAAEADGVTPPEWATHLADLLTVDTVTVDRIVPGCKGGTYRRGNIRPACGPCNSETGGGLRANGQRQHDGSYRRRSA